MNLTIIIFILIILNLVLLFFLNKKKIKKLIYKTEIEEINIEDVHKIFQFKKITKNLKGPKEDVIIKSFSISPSNNVIGMTSDYEAWIIAALSKISKKIFEFGTCSGKTTYLMGLNSSDDTSIVSITLNPDDLREVKKKNLDNKVSFRNIIHESVYNKFLFSGEKVEKKIKVIFQNSLNFEHNEYKNKMDLIFVDGGHTYSVVKNDSEKSFQMINTNGIILWHDYVPEKRSAKDVVKYINKISKTKKIYKIKDTSLCIFKSG
ncbi:class I SAM-dependent methyltransferase [Candidatus Pelagibacter sp.]|nr:class I SAM-dependent methyltransferase [Candidatus Pelagibacter sp.]